mgnify:CR=1 FL=1
MFWFKLKNNLKLIMSALWDDEEKFTKLKNEIEIQSVFQSGGQVDASKLWGDGYNLVSKLKNDEQFTKLKNERDITRLVQRQQDLGFRSKVSRR